MSSFIRSATAAYITSILLKHDCFGQKKILIWDHVLDKFAKKNHHYIEVDYMYIRLTIEFRRKYMPAMWASFYWALVEISIVAHNSCIIKVNIILNTKIIPFLIRIVLFSSSFFFYFNFMMFAATHHNDNDTVRAVSLRHICISQRNIHLGHHAWSSSQKYGIQI